MKDPRIDALAQILVRYYTKVQPGDVTVIQSSTIAEHVRGISTDVDGWIGFQPC